MAFQNLRNGSTVYLLYKTNDPKLDIGQVLGEPKIRQKFPINAQPYPTPQYMPQPQEQVLDLSIKIGDKVQPVEGLTPNTDTQDCGNGLLISCSRDAVNAEVAAFMHNSEVAISEETLKAHQTIVNNCKQIMMQLNPEIAERQRLEVENRELKGEIKRLSDSQKEMKEMMATLLEQLGSPVKKNS